MKCSVKYWCKWRLKAFLSSLSVYFLTFCLVFQTRIFNYTILRVSQIFTDHVRSTTGGDIFTGVCLFTEGGVPLASGLRSFPFPREGEGVPYSGSRTGVPPLLTRTGVPHPLLSPPGHGQAGCPPALTSPPPHPSGRHTPRTG